MKRELQYCRPKRIPDHTRKKMVTKRELIDRLGNRKSTYSKKNTLSYSSSRKRKDTTSKTLAMRLCD